MAKAGKSVEPAPRTDARKAKGSRTPGRSTKAQKQPSKKAKSGSAPQRKTAKSQSSQTAQQREMGSGDVGWFSDAELKEREINVAAEAASTVKGSGVVFEPPVESNDAAQQTVETPESPAARAYTKFDRDRPDSHAEDRLDITPDVEAFAELICLKETKPPLSIGLFGDWGSGKSFFMLKLSETIRELTERTGGDADGLFVSNVVQIKFNAWHYADANLWASLTADFMDQLRAGGADDTRKYEYRQLVNDLATRVGRAEAERDRIAVEADALNQQVAAKAARITALENEKKSVPAALFREAATRHLDDFLAANAPRIDEAGRALGHDRLSSDIATFRQEAQEALTIPGKLRAFARSLVRARGWTVLFVVGILALVAAAAGLFLTDLAGLGTYLLGPLAGGIGATAVAVWQAARRVMPVIEAAARYARDVSVREAELDRTLAAERRTLVGLQKDAEVAENRRSEREVFVERYRAGAAGESPAALLHYFLHESAETRQFEQHLGIVSRVRRAFAQLEMLLKEQQVEGPVDGAPAPDRIVLYIDDLDRCRDKQVVEVLEAVQLLLAFDHIVVIVGVDARWLEHSLKRFYDDKLTEAYITDARTASVVDYLEKIFQIPFWLRPLTFGDGDKEGTYEKLVAGIVGGGTEEVAAPPAPESAPSPPDAETRARINLDEPEIDLLKRLGPLAGRSPRAVTRILNVYRLIRVRRAGPALSRFLGHDGQHPEYPAIMFLLALDAGLRPAEASAVSKVLFSLEEDANVGLLDDIMRAGESAESDVKAHESQPLLWPLADRVISAVHSVESGLGRNLYRKDLDGALKVVSRYSFRHGGMRHQR